VFLLVPAHPGSPGQRAVKRLLLLLLLYCNTMYVDVDYCYRPSSMVSLLVCHSSEPCKNS